MEVVLVIVLFMASTYLVSKRVGSFLFPGSVAFIFFGILYFWNKFGAMTLYYNFELSHALYLIVCLMIFSISSIKGMFHVGNTHVDISYTEIMNVEFEKNVFLLIFVGIIGGLFMVSDNYAASMSLSSNLSDVRESFSTRNIGLRTQLGSVMFGTSLPSLIIGMRQWLRRSEFADQRIGYMLLLLIGTMFAVSISSGGRQAVLELMVCCIAILLYGGAGSFDKNRMKAFLLIFLLIVIIGSSYMLAVASHRSEYGMANESFLVNYWEMDYAEWFIPISKALPKETVLQIVAIHGYFPYNLKGLGVFIDSIDEHSWGGFQGEHILRQFRKLGIEWPFEFSLKSGTNISDINWPTIFGSMIVDFGVLGSIVAMWILGWLSGIQFGKYYYFGFSSAYVMTVLIFVCIFHSTMYSPFQETTLLYGLIWTALINMRIHKNLRRCCVFQSPVIR
jgi:hypothetical protein